jgi:Glutamate decarboxylase and related PLP-dependent proteins
MVSSVDGDAGRFERSADIGWIRRKSHRSGRRATRRGAGRQGHSKADCVHVSAGAFVSVRAAWIAGIARENVRTVAMDDLFRIDVADLKRVVAADRANGLDPFVVVASAGTTNTGSVDPLNEIADYTESESLWLHVDAAYAGFAALSGEGRTMLDGIGRAISSIETPRTSISPKRVHLRIRPLSAGIHGLRFAICLGRPRIED